jgi:hypothetical protein
VPVTNEVAAAETDARSLVELASRIRRVVLWLEALVGLPMMIAGFVLARSEPDSLRMFLLILAPFMVAVPFVIHRFVVHRTRRRAVVLWVRRFHRGKRATIAQTFLEFAVTDWGMLITLSDTDLDTDSATRMMLTWKYYAIFGVFAGIVWLIANGDLSGFLGTLIGFACFLYLRSRKARTDLTSESSKLANMVKRIRAQKLPSSGSVVLRCPRDGDLWRRVITDLSLLVDAAVVSAGENSPYVDWEIQTLIHSLGPNKIIDLIDGVCPAPPLVGTAGTVTVPAKMRWWPGEQHWRSAAITLGSAILRRRT